MRYHTKEYYRLFMALDAADSYEPIIDRDYSDEEIEELYQKASDRYIEEERADYDEPPALMFDDEDLDPEEFDPEDYGLIIEKPSTPEEVKEVLEKLQAAAAEEFASRPPFDEDEARAEFGELYKDNLEEPDEDLPEWVRDAVDPRILAMYFMPEKIYRRLAAEDEENQERFEILDEAADIALGAARKDLPAEYAGFADVLDELEDEYVLEAKLADGGLSFVLTGWDEEGETVSRSLSFRDVEIIEDEGISIEAGEDEDGDPESDCELLYSELYAVDGRPEVHMMFDNNGLKYLTFRCSEMKYE